MRSLRSPWFTLVGMLLLTFSVAPRALAADAVLAQLTPATSGARATVLAIRARAAITPSPLAGKAYATWMLQPGDTLEGNTRPHDRIIELYNGNTGNLTLLCRVWVRYYPEGSKWAPQFQLVEEPTVARTAQGWKPLTLPQGTPLLLAQTGSVLPNAEGFKRALEFGLAAGAISIDAWGVR